MNLRKNQQGFTIIELVIVLIIFGTLIAIGVPRFIDMKDNAERTTCVANQKTIQAAILMEYSKQILQGRQAKLSEIASGAYGKYKYLFPNHITPTCPKDNRKYTVRANDRNGDIYVTCPNYHVIRK